MTLFVILVLSIGFGIVLIATVQRIRPQVDVDRKPGEANVDLSNVEVPKAGELDWDRKGPDVEFPTRDVSITEDKNPETEDATSSSSKSIDNQEQSFDWEYRSQITFDDVGGMSAVKRELQRDVILPYTEFRDTAADLGIAIPNLLLYGPPGTGKTHLARALAGELSLPHVILSGANLQTKWINESASQVHSLFEEAEELAGGYGGAVVFLDEIDTVLRNRSGGSNSHAEDAKVVNAFLTTLQETRDSDVFFIGATNRYDLLDPASTRAGRIDKEIEIGMPDRETRKGMLRTQLQDRPHQVSEGQMGQAAIQLRGATAADIESVVDEAARQAAFERGGELIQWGDMQMALEAWKIDQQ